MEKVWFIYDAEIVTGAYATEQVKGDIMSGRWSPVTQIWWKGSKEWMSIDKWYQHLDEIIEANRQQGQQPVWYAEKHGQQHGPMTKIDLIDLLKKLGEVKQVRLWTIGLNHWTNIFEFHEIIEAIGMSRRNYDRAPIVGKVIIQKNGESFERPLASVSGGGLGLRESGNLIAGETVTVAIQSSLLVNPVRASARVMYVEPTGYAGLQFQNIHIESKTTLIDYVNQFRNDPTSSHKPQRKAS